MSAMVKIVLGLNFLGTYNAPNGVYRINMVDLNFGLFISLT